MPSMNAFFVQKVTDDAIAAVRANFSSSEIITNSEFMHVVGATLQQQALMDLSVQFNTDVMWLSYHSVSGGFAYYHWRTGTLLRALVYSNIEDHTWELVEGQAEDWEQQFFFTAENLADELDDEEDDEEDKLSDEEKQRIERFWQAGQLVVGEHIPSLGAQSCAFHIATYYRFPGWDFEEPHERRRD